MKWKPPSENSIDFKLLLRFPPTPGKPKVPDFQTKPVFELHVWCGDTRYEFYDIMYVDDDEWERLVHFPLMRTCALNTDIETRVG